MSHKKRFISLIQHHESFDVTILRFAFTYLFPAQRYIPKLFYSSILLDLWTDRVDRKQSFHIIERWHAVHMLKYVCFVYFIICRYSISRIRAER